MHSKNCVIVLIDTNTGKTFREYDHSRDGDTSKVRVPIPFGTEYSFRIKTTDGKRRRVQFEIDGASVGELIFTGPLDTLERFIQSSERFKFVKKDDKAVQDPGSPDNGKIVVKVWTEKQIDLIGSWKKICDEAPPYTPPYQPWPHYPYNPCWPYGNQPWWSETICSDHPAVYTSYNVTSANVTTDSSIGSGSAAMGNCLRGCVPESVSSDLKGATVGGSKSDQTFGSTTWAGDDQYCCFEFSVHAPAAAEPEKPKAVAKYCPGCGTKLTESAKFCHECGGLIPIV